MYVRIWFAQLVTTDSNQAQVWQLVTVEGGKKNTYTMWITTDGNGNPVPLRYEMMGYDSLLGSHFDKYIVVYEVYDSNPKFDDDTFQPDSKYSVYYLLFVLVISTVCKSSCLPSNYYVFWRISFLFTLH